MYFILFLFKLINLSVNHYNTKNKFFIFIVNKNKYIYYEFYMYTIISILHMYYKKTIYADDVSTDGLEEDPPLPPRPAPLPPRLPAPLPLP